MRGLKDKVAVVAGAAPGNIGGATAIRLAEEGTAVVVATRNKAAAQSLADEIRVSGGRAVARGFDISDDESFKDLIDFGVKEFGRLDGLFNVAADLSRGNVGRDSDVITIPNDVWHRTIDVTLTGYMYGIRHALPIMIKQGSGAIVNCMSSQVWLGEGQRVAYQAAKAGLYGLTRHTATVGGKHGVRCNIVAPGLVLTRAVLEQLTEEYKVEFLKDVRSPRLGVPDDIAGMVAFLLSDDGAYVNGQTILVDGGRSFT